MVTTISCERCVMDSSAATFRLNDDGSCNFCTSYYEQLKFRDSLCLSDKLNPLVARIRKASNKGSYDCVIGISGGVDSTYIAYLAVQLGLKPLAVHLDNGWNSELAVSNIQNICDKLGIDLYTHVINWAEFRDIQKSFLLASIPGMEIPTDHAIYSILRIVAKQKGIKFILNGSNFRTEHIMEPSWSEYKGQIDWLLIKNIHRRFGTGIFKSFPKTTRLDYYLQRVTKNPEVIFLLDYINFQKDTAQDIITRELGWRDYGGKHYESIYTRFTQGYIQPIKFGIDKRKAHFSNLICSGNMSKTDADEYLNKSPYPNQDMLDADLRLFLKKMGLSNDEFQGIMEKTPLTYKSYPGYHNHWFHAKLFSVLQKLWYKYKRLRKID